jgi:enediyne biosynthesis protein E3
MEITTLGKLRTRIFLPDDAEVTFERRGFIAPDAARQANLETVGRKFLKGFEYAIGGRTLDGIEAELETVEPTFRGFAYEGAAMALAVRDGLRPARPHWIRDLLGSRGAAHVYMVYVGVGWAMARLPTVRWRAIMPADPVLSWLALDGYGFHQAYFKTPRYVGQQHQGRIPVWPRGDYPNRAVDQGIGRALWFVNGADVDRVAATIGRFAASRRGDLWSGAALASVYAGGADAGELSDMVRLAGEYRAHAAQGAAFAAKARLLAGLVTPGTELGVKVHCDMSVAEAAAVADEMEQGLPADGDLPAYEVWRERIRNRFS